MKKIALFSVLALSALFTGCFNPVFSNIEKEVPLVKGTVSGTVNSIVRFENGGEKYLVTHTGGDVFYKKVKTERTSDDSVWTKRDKGGITPVDFSYEIAGTSENGMSEAYIGEMFIKLAADASNVYALTTSFYVNAEGEVAPEKYNLYSSSSFEAKWTKIESVDANLAVGKSTLFCTNSVDPANRHAYLRGYSEDTERYVYYELSGGSAAVNDSMSTMLLADGETSSSKVTIKSAVYSGGAVKFFSSTASVANDRDSTYYYAKGNDIYVGGEKEPVCNNSNPVMCLALTSDYLIIGARHPDVTNTTIATGGISHAAIVDGGKLDKVNTSFTSNAASVFTSSYELNALLVEDPEKKEDEANIFAATAFKSSGNSVAVSYENVGLWAYYPTRGNWNRE